MRKKLKSLTWHPPNIHRKQRLVYSILDFLQGSIDDGSIKEDDKEGIEVASACISVSSVEMLAGLALTLLPPLSLACNHPASNLDVARVASSALTLVPTCT